MNQNISDLKAKFLEREAWLLANFSPDSCSIDKWERILGNICGCRRILQDIESVEKGAASLAYLQKRLDTNLDYLRSNHVGTNTSVDNFQGGVENAWLELKNWFENESAPIAPR